MTTVDLREEVRALTVELRHAYDVLSRVREAVSGPEHLSGEGLVEVARRLRKSYDDLLESSLTQATAVLELQRELDAREEA